MMKWVFLFILTTLVFLNFSPNHECPYCNAVVTPNDVLRIFPSEDEETEELAAKFNEAKASGIENQICQMKDRLEENKAKFEEEQLQHENLKWVLTKHTDLTISSSCTSTTVTLVYIVGTSQATSRSRQKMGLSWCPWTARSVHECGEKKVYYVQTQCNTLHVP